MKTTTLESLFTEHAGSRVDTMLMALHIISQCDLSGEFIETGTWRGCAGDGMSTYLFGLVAAHYGKILHSVDNNQSHINASIDYCKCYPEINVTHHHCDSVEFLNAFVRPISVLYLDSMDYIYGNHEPCQLHNLAETEAASSKMTSKSLIVCDDSDLPCGGKPELTIKWLVGRGWKLIAKQQQAVLTNWDYVT